MFRNFISKLRNPFQPANDSTNYSQRNNSKVVKSSHFKDQNSVNKTTKDDKVFYNGSITIPHGDSTVDLDSNALKSVVVEELCHYESIISSDGEFEPTKDLVNDAVEPSLRQFENSIDNNACIALEKLFQNKDYMLNSAEKENFEPNIPTNNNKYETAKLLEDAVDLNLIANLIEGHGVTKNIGSEKETQNTDSIDADELPCELNMTLKGFSNLEIQVTDENTKTCLKEFNAVLNEVRNKDGLLFQNVDDSLEDIDDIVLIDDASLEIDTLSLLGEEMCEENNTIIINDDDEDRPLIDKSQPKDVISDNLKNRNTIVPKAQEFKTVESNKCEAVKETFTKSYKRTGLSNNNDKNKLTAYFHEDENSSGNIIEIDDNNEIISISSEDEMDKGTKHSQQSNSEALKTDSKDIDFVKISTDFNKYVKNRKLKNDKKIVNKIKKTRTNISGNVEVGSTLKKWIDDSNQNMKQNKTQGKTKTHSNSTSIESKDNHGNPKNGQDPNNNKAELLYQNREEVDTKYKTQENTQKTVTETNHKENLKTVALNSEDLEKMSTESDDNDDCGYHSSDFEFITEEEAKKGGLITNERKINKYKTRQKQSYATRNIYFSKVQNDPYGPGPSNRCFDNSEEQVNYVVPDENELINIFQALPPMPTSEIHFLENKSIQSQVPMLVQYEGLGFEVSLALHRDNDSGVEYREEAEESMKKILDIYPENNISTRSRRKRRRMI